MRSQGLFATLLLIFSANSLAGIFDGPDLKTLAEFKGGNFQFQSVKSIHWPQIVQGNKQSLEQAEKVWVPARLYMPAKPLGKVPAMVISHGIGGLYTRDGRKRAYWEYAELLSNNGVAAIVVDTHGARGVGVASQSSQSDVSLYAFLADAFAAADMLRTHPGIDGSRIGIMGFSKGGGATLLATDVRAVKALSTTTSAFNLHIPIYPGCQVFPEKPQPTKAPVRMLLGEKDNYTGISGCLEIETTLKALNVPVETTIYPGAFHGWDEDLARIRIEDKSSEDCRWALRDGGGVAANGKLLQNAAESQEYLRGCLKSAEIYAGRNERANSEGRAAVVKAALDVLAK